MNYFLQRFNSNLLQKQTGNGSKQRKFCTLATGSRDCALVVWSTCMKRPVFSMKRLFEKSVGAEINNLIHK